MTTDLAHPVKTTVVLVNPRGGSAGEDPVAAIDLALASAGVHERRVVALAEGDDPVAVAREAVASGAGCVVACGGDGTVSAVASALVGTGVPLGIIPLGTSNSIAAALGLPSALDAACAAIAGSGQRVIDTAVVAGRAMLLMATIGVHARAITEADDDVKSKVGVLAYVAKGVEVALEDEPFEATISIDAQAVFTVRARSLTVANLAPVRSVLAQGPAELLPDDGLLDLTVVTFEGVLDALATAAHLLRTAVQGEAAQRENIGWASGSVMRVEATPAQKLMIDGEAVGETPFEARVLPASLVVRVPG